ncbi:MAG: tetratricopeptide repeat protein [Isosphaeraceae bacterium]|nr:tetratricopeptide repeat protein [Isosphaeraceae bacterium]
MGTRSGLDLAVAVIVFVLIAAPTGGQEPVAVGTGSRVVLRSREAALKVGKEVVASSDVFRVYHVEHVRGGWVWVADDGIRGWVREADVVPLDQALAYFTSAIKERPGDPWPYQMRGLVYAYLRDFEHAIADDTEAIKLDPRDPVSYHNRGNARLAREDYDGAIADYNRATALDPKDAASYVHRALAWAAKHDYDLAIADDNQAIRLDSRDVATYHQRALAWAAKQDYEQALADYAEALKINPDDALAYNGRAWIWATAADPNVRDGHKAVQSAARANELSGGSNPYILGTLAAASAEQGDFDAAVRWQTKALERFAAEHLDQGAHRRRLELYKSGKPFRDERQN